MKEVDLVYEDNHLIVVNKPTGVVTQEAQGASVSLEELVKAWLKEKYHKPGNVFLGVVHRLDKPVSGLVLFAKTSKALTRLNEAFRAKTTEKTYYALVEGSPQQQEGVLEHEIAHGDHRAWVKGQEIPKNSSLSFQKARLHYKVLSQRSEGTLLQIILETGRYHQIRCQCSVAGFPIVGDIKYGGIPTKKWDGVFSIALHHGRLKIIHPITQEEMVFEASWDA